MKITYIEIEADAQELRANQTLSEGIYSILQNVFNPVYSGSGFTEDPEDTEECDQ